jgi:hypothetical protein
MEGLNFNSKLINFTVKVTLNTTQNTKLMTFNKGYGNIKNKKEVIRGL